MSIVMHTQYNICMTACCELLNYTLMLQHVEKVEKQWYSLTEEC
jgi:hypothetical protein